ncbi:MAG: ABC transporter substrate-binding protein [Bacteroidia bacterium]|nr:ABC transporter substrate-binding protein [Bacteroidia bacterium]
MGKKSTLLLFSEGFVAGCWLLATRCCFRINQKCNFIKEYKYLLRTASSQIPEASTSYFQIIHTNRLRARFYFLFIPLLILGVFNCAPGKKKSSDPTISGHSLSVSYAKGFAIIDYGKYRKITVLDPWEQSTGMSFEYYLIDHEKNIPVELKGKQIIRTPVRSVICLSTSHIGFLRALNEITSLKALSGAAFVSDPEVLELVASKKVFDVGYDQGINYELILSLKPDLIIAYGVGGEVTGFINKLRDLGLNVILNGEYLEESPLAKTEWIKFVGAFYNKDQEAADYFSKIEKNYNGIKQSVISVKSRPVVLTGLPYKDAWWMAGGHSNLATLIGDAGGKFLWDENTSREAFVVSLEQVVIRSAKADFWINCGTVNTLNELLSADSRFTVFPQVRKKAIFNNNLSVSPGGGNDYWERGVVRPDLILADLVKIFHPECDSGKVFNFYKRIE